MVREIKFRGFDATGQKGWVYGDLVHNQKVTRTGLEPRTMVGGYEVVPESVGQFTGLKDKNGKEIYEGDIVDADCGNGYSFFSVVVWHKGLAGFMLDEGDSCYSPIPSSVSEVIDNIYENKNKK